MGGDMKTESILFIGGEVDGQYIEIQKGSEYHRVLKRTEPAYTATAISKYENKPTPLSSSMDSYRRELFFYDYGLIKRYAMVIEGMDGDEAFYRFCNMGGFC
jgi:hypothetical protein